MKRSRATEEIVRIISDMEWHSTSEIAIRVGDYIRPEIVWRQAKRSQLTIDGARRAWVSHRLKYWHKMGLVKKRKRNNTSEWRCVNPYGLITGTRVTAEDLLKVSYLLRVLAEKLREGDMVDT